MLGQLKVTCWRTIEPTGRRYRLPKHCYPRGLGPRRSDPSDGLNSNRLGVSNEYWTTRRVAVRGKGRGRETRPKRAFCG
jgi:hypothetical protein